MKIKEDLTQTDIRELQKIIKEKCGYLLNKTLLKQAFTRKSYSVLNDCEHNETLEYLGDSVLNFFVNKRIINKYYSKNNNGEFIIYADEGKLTSLKNSIINNENLANIIDKWKVVEYLLVRKTELDSLNEKQSKYKADLFEAIVGAITVQSNWDYALLEEVINKMLSLDDKLNELSASLNRNINYSLDNAVSYLKTLAERGECSYPAYDANIIGNNENGNPDWACRCSVTNQETGYIVTVFSNSKKNAKKAAAYLILCKMFKQFNEYGSNGLYLIWEYKDGKIEPMK